MIDLDRLHRLLFLLFNAQFAVTALIFVEVFNTDLLFDKGTLADRALGIGIRLVVRSFL